MLALMQEIAHDGLACTDPSSPAAARLRQMGSFYRYLLAELPALIQRWHETSGESESDFS